MDSPGPAAHSTLSALGAGPRRLRDMSPVYHARAPNSTAFLLLQARHAVEFAAALHAAGTTVDVHIFEGESFEGHMAMLLRIGDPNYPATGCMGLWLH